MGSNIFPGQMHMQLPRSYNDTILTITNQSCADPYVLWDKGIFYMVSIWHHQPAQHASCNIISAIHSDLTAPLDMDSRRPSRNLVLRLAI